MKIALIGLGDIAQKAYLPMLAGRQDTDWILCSRNARMLAALTAQYGFRQSCTDYRELPKHQIDAVMIHAATDAHYSLARFFLEQGIPTFVDKPLCDSYSGCESLYELATQNNTPLFVGFNRRYLPLITAQTDHPDENTPRPSELRSVRWEKHRYNMPGRLRSMIFDDFIHVLDSVNLTGQLHHAPLQLTAQFAQEKLARIDCHWQYSGRIYEASMDRQFGATCERIRLGYRNKTLELDSLVSGHWLEGGEKRAVNLSDWTPMLAGKGFYAMLEH
jgi:virulence factor